MMHKAFFLPGSPATPDSLPFDREHPWLAPLAGYSDLPFRLLCRRYGAAVCVTEMVSAKGLVYRSPGTGELLQSLPEDQQVKARAILEEARPAIEDTRWRIRQKREELARFDYAEDSSAETLSRLGWELQALRDRLRLQLAQLEGRLLDEVGVSFRRAGKSRGCNSMIRQDVIHTYSLQESLEPCP